MTDQPPRISKPDDIFGRGFSFAAHKARHVVLATLVVEVLAPILWPGSLAAVGTITAVALAASVIFHILHLISGEICLRCASEVPLDPQEKVALHMPVLWLHHLRFGVKMAAVLALFSVTFFVSIAPWDLTGILASLIVYASMLSEDSHRKLSMWCPYCRKGGGGWDDADAPVPDPHEVGRG